MCSSDLIEAQIRATGLTEISSARVGALAMAALREIDQIAYIRFASVYQSFDDLEQLKREVDELYAARTDAVPGQTSLELIDHETRAVRGPILAGTRSRGAR